MRRLACVLCVALISCSRSPLSPPAPPEVRLQVAYGSEKKTWMDEQVRAFEASAPKTKNGRPIRVMAGAYGSGEAVQGILSGELKPHVFSPASGAYLTLLNDSWLRTAGHTKAIAPAGDPLLLSPIVIAMWKPMAEALGWPGKRLGWADLLRVNGTPGGWRAFHHPEWGSFKLGHTHPEYSNSGLLSVLAEGYAGAHKARQLGAGDLEAKPVRDFVTAVEGTIVHYGKSTGFFADKMVERGPSYLSAAVLYENLIIESYSKPNPSGTPLVAVYPVEGTFWSDHPYSVLDADWVTADEREAATAFQAFLRARPAQERALQLGFRPADASIPIGAPIDVAHGVDAKQPQTLLEVPDAAVLRKLLEVWQSAKRSAEVTLVLDKSGSMNGRPLREAKAGARAFLTALHDSDEVTLLPFDHRLLPPTGPVALGSGRAVLLDAIEQIEAGGGTSLYDATAAAFAHSLELARKDRGRIHAVVVMTDGKDESSKMSLDALRLQLSIDDSPVKVFTIAYGSQADPRVLGSIADAARGSSLKGSAENIVQVYQEVAAFF
jgi:Ca-activated chloride channel family protein